MNIRLYQAGLALLACIDRYAHQIRVTLVIPTVTRASRATDVLRE
jgi:hypothetical protein